MNARILILAAAIVAGCSGGPTVTTGPTPLRVVSAPTLEPLATEAPPVETPKPDKTAAPSPTSKPGKTAGPAPTPKPGATPKPLLVKVTARTGSVRRNGTASVTIRTTPGSTCGIDVQYASGSSTADGLADRKTGTTGVVVWKWKVGANTTRGTWPIDVTCTLHDRYGSASTTFTVK